VTRSASVVPLDQNRWRHDRAARGRALHGQSRDGLERQLLATLASAASLMEATSLIQKQAAEALRALAEPGGDEDAARPPIRVEDATRQFNRIEQAIQVLTSSPGRPDWPDRRDRPLWPAEARRHPKRPAEPLTARETVVLRLLCGTLSLGGIGRELDVSKNTVKSHVQAIYRKLGVSCRRDAIGRGRELSIVLLPAGCPPRTRR
jgi:ATP/maltotriose-dependent transcriptional regulator MalT